MEKRMERADCWMGFTEALEQYLGARAEKVDAPFGCQRWEQACEEMKVAAEHMDALTSKDAKTERALVRARLGFLSEQATGMPVLADWRTETLAIIDDALPPNVL
jgi:hypothetical protein